jgi:hypothetical protein
VRYNVILTVSLAFVMLGTASIITAAVPHQMQYQGHLTDEGGAPLDTVISMTFTIYDDETAGATIWTETQPSVEVSAGLFNVLLGSQNGIPDTAFDDTIRWLGIQIGSDPEIVPRTKLVTVPFAFQALSVATVDGATGGNVYGNLRLHSYLYVGDYDGEAGYLEITDGTDNTIMAYGTTGSLDMEGDLDISGKATLGWGNINTGADAFVAGRANEVTEQYATVGGGFGNTAAGLRSTVGGGMRNFVGSVHATVAGGYGDTVDASSGTIGGGFSNRISEDYGTVSGGNQNIVSGTYGTIGGGWGNSATALRSTVPGGGSNTASGPNSIVSGGVVNAASGSGSAVGGGQADTASGGYSVVCGGYLNVVGGDRSTISGGNSNRCSGDSATISGGSRNSATGNNSVIAGGTGNEAAFISLGPPMDPLGGWSTVGGGRDNRALGDYSTIGGGQDNTAAAGWTPTYGGYSTVAGGQDNHAFAMYSTVGGGRVDSARTQYATVGGGYMNVAGAGLLANPDSGEAATVAGGYSNRAAGYFSAIGGGESNTASGWYSTVSGGIDNDNAGSYSTIPGGYNGTLTSNANYSMAFGRDVYVNTAYRVVFFDSAYSGRLGINRDDHSGVGIAHPIHVGTDGTNGNGAHLTAGGTWTNGSSRTIKENFQSLNPRELLAKISGLPVEGWNYKGTDERHIGPVSEDFVAAFDVGTVQNGRRDNKYLSPGDVAGVALAGVKELVEENQELRQVIEELQQRITDLENAKTSR